MIYFQILQEEKYLEKTFGEEYLNYKKNISLPRQKKMNQKIQDPKKEKNTLPKVFVFEVMTEHRFLTIMGNY